VSRRPRGRPFRLVTAGQTVGAHEPVQERAIDPDGRRHDDAHRVGAGDDESPEGGDDQSRQQQSKNPKQRHDSLPAPQAFWLSSHHLRHGSGLDGWGRPPERAPSSPRVAHEERHVAADCFVGRPGAGIDRPDVARLEIGVAPDARPRTEGAPMERSTSARHRGSNGGRRQHEPNRPPRRASSKPTSSPRRG
jgi:hypothetical protein